MPRYYTFAAISVVQLAMLFPESPGLSCAEERFLDRNHTVIGDMDLLFAPGDACFPFRLSEDDVSDLGKGSCVLSYREPPQFDRLFTPGMGFSTCVVELDADTRNSVSFIYKQYRRRFPKLSVVGLKQNGDARGRSSETEFNPMYGFIYQKQVELAGIQIGWRYNEQWQNDAAQLLQTTPASTVIPVRYSTYAIGSDGIVSEMFHARKVSSLPTLKEETLERGFRDRNRTPLRLVGEFKVVVIPEELIEDVQHLKRGCAEYGEAGSSARFFMLDRFSDAWVDCTNTYASP